LLKEVIGNVDLQSQKDFEMQVIQLDKNCYRVSGMLSITHWDTFFKNTLIRMNSHEDIATLGGLVVSLLKKYPKVGDRVMLGEIEFSVDEMFGHRIGWVKVRIRE
jgi:CBS domain containing-hemolysin-like protein